MRLWGPTLTGLAFSKRGRGLCTSGRQSIFPIYGSERIESKFEHHVICSCTDRTQAWGVSMAVNLSIRCGDLKPYKYVSIVWKTTVSGGAH